MTPAQLMVDQFSKAGFGIIAGVPCSSLGGLINAASAHPAVRYIGAANEGDAVAIAAGAWLAGSRGAVFMQNSGLGNAINPLTSLVSTFAIPMRLVIGWRGRPIVADEPQHRLMGEITPALLRLCEFEIMTLAPMAVETATHAFLQPTDRNLALLVDGDDLRGNSGKLSPAANKRPRVLRNFCRGGARPSRVQAIKTIVSVLPDNAAVFSTTGKCSRELFESGDQPNYFYQVGSMGCVSSLALGFSLVAGRRTVVLDGDGAALMRLGSLATVGVQQPAGLVHVVLDNEAHDSTGGQPTATVSTDLAAVAVACGYPRVARCDDRAGVEQALAWGFAESGPIFIHAKIAAGSAPGLGRPTLDPADAARRFRLHFKAAA